MIKVGFIGMGNQGAPIARRIIDAGHPTTLWARRPETLEPYADTPAAIAPTPAALAAAVDVVGVCVWDGDAVEEVVCGRQGLLEGMPPGGVIAVHSTVSPDTCRRLGVLAAARGIALVDAPVSGGPVVAAAGRLLVMVGGEPADVERCRPVFETFGDPVVHVGPLGSGQVTKLMNNLLLASYIGLSDAVLSLGSLLGLDRSRLGEALVHGAHEGLGYMVRLDAVAALDPKDRPPRTRTSDWATKDVGLVVELAREMGVGPEQTALALGLRGAVLVDERS